ncbi:MAG: DEAD/DEAH box helicase family protein, partial [Pseudobdellovibrionaceae bacterium]
IWENNFAGDYKAWCDSGFQGASTESREWLQRFEANVRFGAAQIRAEPYQREAILRLIYMLEIGSKDAYFTENMEPGTNLATKMATGSGKTVVLAHIISWAKTCGYADFFLVLCPNTIVRERLWEGLGQGYFSKIGFQNNLEVINLANSSQQNFEHVSVAITNIHQIMTETNKGTALREYLSQSGRKFLVINDEAHNSVTNEYDNVMSLFEKMNCFSGRLDLTATPRRPDNLPIPSHFTFDYPVISGIEGVGTFPSNVLSERKEFRLFTESYRNDFEGKGRQVLKQPYVVRPKVDEVSFDIKAGDGHRKVKVSGEDLAVLISNENEEERKLIKEKYKLPGNVRRSHISSSKAFQDAIITEGVKELFVKRIEAKSVGDNNYQPILFIVALNRKEAESCVQILKSKALKPLLVIGSDDKSGDDNGSGLCSDDFVIEGIDELDEMELKSEEKKVLLRQMVNKLGKPFEIVEKNGIKIQCNFDAVVSVYMLKEGWDVNCVEVMCLLRPFESRLFAEQTIGRGLRIRRDVPGNFKQTLCIVEPPSWGLDELWFELGVEVPGTDNSRLRELLKTLTSANRNWKEKAKQIVGEIVNESTRLSLSNVQHSRVDLLTTILGGEDFKIRSKDAVNFIIAEAQNTKDVSVVQQLVPFVRDPKLGNRINELIASGEVEKIPLFISLGEDPQHQENEKRAGIQSLLLLEGLASDRRTSLRDEFIRELNKFPFDEFLGLDFGNDEMQITSIKNSGYETVKAGQRTFEHLPAVFHHLIETAEDGSKFLSAFTVIEEKFKEICTFVDQVIAKGRFAAGGVYRITSHQLKKSKFYRMLESDRSISWTTEAEGTWRERASNLRDALYSLVERLETGADGNQTLPDLPRVPTGTSDLNAYNLSLFKKEYTQASYEREFAIMLDSGIFNVGSTALTELNGFKVKAWTTSHGIEVPYGENRIYNPDFLVCLEASDKFRLWLIVEVKSESELDDEVVRKKAEAARAFASVHKNCRYAIITRADMARRVA